MTSRLALLFCVVVLSCNTPEEVRAPRSIDLSDSWWDDDQELVRRILFPFPWDLFLLGQSAETVIEWVGAPSSDRIAEDGLRHLKWEKPGDLWGRAIEWDLEVVFDHADRVVAYELPSNEAGIEFLPHLGSGE